MARHALYAVLALLIAFAATLPARAQDNAIPSLPDPILVNIVPPQNFAGQSTLGFSFQSDSDR